MGIQVSIHRARLVVSRSPLEARKAEGEPKPFLGLGV